MNEMKRTRRPRDVAQRYRAREHDWESWTPVADRKIAKKLARRGWETEKQGATLSSAWKPIFLLIRPTDPERLQSRVGFDRVGAGRRIVAPGQPLHRPTRGGSDDA